MIFLIYIAILIARLFRIIYIIIAYFDLKIKQFNIINVFINIIKSSSGLLIIYKLLPGFKKPGYIIKVD